MAVTRSEAVNFCRRVLKMKDESLRLIDQSVFFNEYAKRFTLRIPFTSLFDNYHMESRGYTWNTITKEPSNMVSPGLLWISGLLKGTHGSSCQVAASFSRLLFQSLGLESMVLMSKVHIFPLPILHAVMHAQSNSGEQFLIDLGNRLTPLPMSLSLDLPVGERSEVVEAGDTYTFMIRTGEKTFERWVRYSVDDSGTLSEPKLFCSFSLENEMQFFDEASMCFDLNALLNPVKKWNIPVDAILDYWSNNVPICGFNHEDLRIIRVINKEFKVQQEPRIGSGFDTFQVKTFDDYCRNVFLHFPYFENEEFICTMSRFWNRKYGRFI